MGLVAGLITWLALYAIFMLPFGKPSFLPLQAVEFVRLLHATFLETLINLLPAAVAALVATHLSLLVGTIAGAITHPIALFQRSVDFDTFISQHTTALFFLLLVGAIYGAAGAALGLALTRSNKSFKPNPLRGSA
jgi:hypothetical protein